MNIQNTINNYTKEFSELDSWIQQIYDDYFLSDFDRIRHLYDRFKSDSSPITDDELEEILTYAPLDLFTATENLSKLKTHRDVLKIEKKAMDAKSKSDKTPNLDASANLEITILVLSNITDRVDREISFTKELIMATKKIWDRRKAAETIGAGVDTSTDFTDTELPVYQTNSESVSQQYIK